MLTVPILILTFNRPDLLSRQLERLRTIKPYEIYISSDGPRLNNINDIKKVEECRKIIEVEIDWKCIVKTKYEATNLGCGVGVSSAITWFFNQVESGIILEDDCLVSDSFFDFCEKMLEKYKNDKNIGGISADYKLSSYDIPANYYSYISFPLIWGWATWSRVWKQYDYNIESWKEENINRLFEKFPDSGRKYWSKNFNKVLENKIDTWDYQLAYLVISKKLKFIHPLRNMVTNIGFGPEASHTKSKIDKMSNLPLFEIKGPYKEYANFEEYDNYLKNSYFIHRSILSKLVERLKIIIKSKIYLR